MIPIPEDAFAFILQRLEWLARQPASPEDELSAASMRLIAKEALDRMDEERPLPYPPLDASTVLSRKMIDQLNREAAGLPPEAPIAVLRCTHCEAGTGQPHAPGCPYRNLL